MSECIAIIPARSGSKGIKNKNLKKLGNHPLLAYSIAAAKLAVKIDRVIVSTDSEIYADVAISYGAEVPFLRPKDLSKDKSTDFEFMFHAMQWLKNNENNKTENWAHLRPTTPLRDPSIIDEAIDILDRNNEATSLRSCHSSPESPFKWFRENKSGYLTALTSKDTDLDKYNDSRQSYPNVLVPNGYIDVVKRSVVETKKKLHGNKMIAFESPICIEVDSAFEFEFLEFQIENLKSPLKNYFKSMSL